MAGNFERERVRHELRVRTLTVVGTSEVTPGMRRVTLSGDDLVGFVSPAPADHVKAFFPDPDTGETAVPRMTSEGPKPPESGTVISRDYTPLGFRPDGAAGPELDLDFVIHGDEGPASAWAARATIGDTLTIAGPRGSHLPPAHVGQLVIVADESALPAAGRWLEHAAPGTKVTGLLSVTNPATSAYLPEGENRTLHWFTGEDRDARVASALRELTIDDGTFLFLAGEAQSLVPLRRYLRRELGLPASQVDVSGYWKRGEGGHDHHAPVDPSDPED